MKRMEKSIRSNICDKRLPARVKRKMVRPTMVYELEMMTVTKKQVEEMEVAKMKALRFAMGVTKKVRLEMSTQGYS